MEFIFGFAVGLIFRPVIMVLINRLRKSAEK